MVEVDAGGSLFGGLLFIYLNGIRNMGLDCVTCIGHFLMCRSWILGWVPSHYLYFDCCL